MARRRIASRHGERTFKSPLSVRVSAEIVRTGGHVRAVSRIRLHDNALLAISPSPVAMILVAARGWFDHLLRA